MDFNSFWQAYPKRRGSNPKVPARTKWDAALKSGVEPERIINSARAYADELRETGKLNTEFVCQAVTWLNQKRYEDYAVDPGSVERNAKIERDMAVRGWKWNGEKWEQKCSYQMKKL